MSALRRSEPRHPGRRADDERGLSPPVPVPGRSAPAVVLAAALLLGGGIPQEVLAGGAPQQESGTEVGERAPEPATREGGPPVTIGSKPFGESYLLGELAAQLLESRGHDVDRRLGLGATEIAFQALRAGGIDLYPEYTGTGLLAILDREPEGDARSVFRTVQREFRERWDVRWLPPLGFENTFAVAVRREMVEELGIRTLSDLAALADQLVAGFSPDFLGRSDGLPGLRETYDLEFRDTRSLMQAVKYEALAEQRVDVIDGYSTDGFVERYDFVILDDDRGFFPPYEASFLVGPRLWNRRPEVVRVLSELSGLFDEALMRRLNRRIEVDGEPLARVAREGLEEVGLLDAEAVAAGEEGAEPIPPGVEARRGVGVVASLPGYLWERRADLWAMTLRHLFLVGVSLTGAILLAVPLGLALERTRRAAESVIRGVGLLQTIPSIALLAFMIPLLGIGALPAVVALFLYSLFPILRNTFTGIRDADPAAVGAARALGMTPVQLLLQVRLPLAAPVIMAGVRTAGVINVGTATLAAFIGAGGLGDPIVSGLALSDTRMILSGAVPAALLAMIVDGLLAGAEAIVSPEGVGEAEG